MGIGSYLFNISDDFRHNILAVQRVMVAAEAVVVVGADYKYTMDVTNRGLKEGDPEDDAERARRMSALHTRSANRLREMLSKNGGIYIKLVSFEVFEHRAGSW
jgi:aarF domain-containing kinase